MKDIFKIVVALILVVVLLAIGPWLVIWALTHCSLL